MADSSMHIIVHPAPATVHQTHWNEAVIATTLQEVDDPISHSNNLAKRLQFLHSGINPPVVKDFQLIIGTNVIYIIQNQKTSPNHEQRWETMKTAATAHTADGWFIAYTPIEPTYKETVVKNIDLHENSLTNHEQSLFNLANQPATTPQDLRNLAAHIVRASSNASPLETHEAKAQKERTNSDATLERQLIASGATTKEQLSFIAGIHSRQKEIPANSIRMLRTNRQSIHDNPGGIKIIDPPTTKFLKRTGPNAWTIQKGKRICRPKHTRNKLDAIKESEEEHWMNTQHDSGKAAITALTRILAEPTTTDTEVSKILKRLRYIAHTRRADNDVIQRRATANALTIAAARQPRNSEVELIIESCIMLLVYGYATKKVYNAVIDAHKKILKSIPARVPLLFARVQLRILTEYKRQNFDEKALSILDTWSSDMVTRCAKFQDLDIDKLLLDLENLRHETDRPGTAHEVPRKLKYTTWRNSKAPPTSGKSKNHDATIYASWNTNGFSKRFEMGEITQFVWEHQPDVLCCTETRLSAGLADPWTVRQTLFNLGYNHIVWHDNAEMPQNHGIMVATKREAKITVGLNNETIDKEGRVITVEFDDHAAVLCYAPCTKFGSEPNPKREIWAQSLTKHILALNERIPTFVQGDLNIAPTPEDCTATFPVQPNIDANDIIMLNDKATINPDRVPSLKPQERKQHHEMMIDTGLCDAIIHYHEGSSHPPITWSKTETQRLNGEGLRIDHTLAPSAMLMKNPDFRTPIMADAHADSNPRGSDHVAVLATIVNNEMAFKRAKALAAIRMSNQTAIGLAYQIAYAATEQRRTIATKTLTRHIGDRVPQLPDVTPTTKSATPTKANRRSDQQKDDIFLLLAKLCIHADEPPTPPQPPRRHIEDEHRNNSEHDVTAERIHDQHIAAAIAANSSQSTKTVNADRQLPQVMLQVNNYNAALTALIDTGAAYSIISDYYVRKHKICVQPMDSDSTLFFKMANGVRCKPRGTANLSVIIGDHNVDVEFHILPHCPFEALIGSDFNTTHGGIVNYRTNTWTIAADGIDVEVEFHTVHGKCSALTVTPMITGPTEKEKQAKDGGNSKTMIVIPARTVQRVPIAIDTSDANISKDDLASGAVFGLFTGTKNAQFFVNNGVGNIETSPGKHSFVVVTNPTDEPLRLKHDTVLATFSPDALEYDTEHDSIETAPDTDSTNKEGNVTIGLANSTDTDTRTQEVRILSDADLDEAIATSKWLKDLDLADATKNLTTTGNRRLRELVLIHERLWDEDPKIPPPSTIKCTIKLKATPKLNGNMPQINPSVRKELAKILNDKLDRGIIEPGNGPYSSTVLLLPKPKGGLRFVLDYRALNECIKADAYTLPQVEEVLSTLHGSTLFSAIDIKEAFWSVPLDEDSKQLTGFRTPIGLFQYTRMPMGLKTASAVFCRFLDSVVGDLRWSVALTYIDDVLIYTKNERDHLDALQTLFERLNRANLTLKASKTSLTTTTVMFLGNIVDKDGHRPDPIKIKAIEAIKLPQTAKRLQSALGNLGYYRKFVKGYASKTHPLREKMQAKWKKDKAGKAIWTDTERKSFFEIRDILSSEPVLAHPDWSQPFEVHTDASQEGLGAVLVQRRTGREHSIMYASRAITAAEQPFAIWELEALAVVWACRLFRMYLYGTRFKIITDSQAVTTICKASYKASGGRLARWSMALNDFNYELVHRDGKRNAGPDLLSRNPINSTQPYGEEPTDIDPHPILALSTSPDTEQVSCALKTDSVETAHNEPTESEWNITSPFTGKAPFFKDGDAHPRTTEEWIHLQEQDATCQRIRATMTSNLQSQRTETANMDNRFGISKMDTYKIDDKGLLLVLIAPRDRDISSSKGKIEKNWAIVTPYTCRAFVMYRYHTLPMSGHHGRDNTIRNIRQRYYWRGMNKDIGRWIRACAVCRKRKDYRRTHAGEASSISIATRPHDTIAIDLVSATTTHATGDKYILTSIDIYTRWAIAIPIRSKKIEHIADALFRHIFCVHGRPNYIRTDEGSEFVNKGLRYLYRRWGIKPISTGGYQPQALPVERFHRFLNAAMTTLAAKFGDDWTTYIPAVTFAYNSSVTVTTGYSPFALTYGRDPQLMEDMDIIHSPIADDEIPESNYAVALAKRLQRAYDHVREQQGRLIEASRLRRSKKDKPFEYKIDDQILYWEPQQTRRLHNDDDTDAEEDNTNQKGPAKWTPKWTGPHSITAKNKPPKSRNMRYTFRHVEKAEDITTHPNRLCLFQPWATTSPSTSWDLDDHRPYTTGSWVKENSLVVVPLNEPYPFGIGKVLKAEADGTLDIQWLGTNGDNMKPHRAALQLGWLPKTKFEPYYNTLKRNKHHRHYKVADDYDIPFHQEDVVLHSFDLTDSKKLPALVVRAISEHPSIWWTQKDTPQSS